MPIEIVRATGFHPEIARGSSVPTPHADEYVEPDVLPNRLEQLIEALLNGRLAHVARIVLPRTSDADYKCFLYVRELARLGRVPATPPAMLFDLLQSCGAEVRSYDISRTRALCDVLASASGRMPSGDDLRKEIERANAARRAARHLVALRLRRPRVSGSEAFPLLASFWEMDPERYVASVTAAAADITTRPPLVGPRVLLAGAPVDSPLLHQQIEAHGAIVVAETGAWGSGVAGDDVRLDDDPLAALADKYRVDAIGPRTPLGAMRRRTEQLLDDVDAVVVSLPPHDAVFGWDYPGLRDRLEARGLPHVCLRGDPYQPLRPVEHAGLDALIAAASRAQETRHG